LAWTGVPSTQAVATYLCRSVHVLSAHHANSCLSGLPRSWAARSGREATAQTASAYTRIKALSGGGGVSRHPELCLTPASLDACLRRDVCACVCACVGLWSSARALHLKAPADQTWGRQGEGRATFQHHQLYEVSARAKTTQQTSGPPKRQATTPSRRFHHSGGRKKGRAIKQERERERGRERERQRWRRCAANETTACDMARSRLLGGRRRVGRLASSSSRFQTNKQQQ